MNETSGETTRSEPLRVTSRAPVWRRALFGIARGLRDGWLILGLTFGFILLLEVAFRVQSRVRQGIASRVRSAPQAPSAPFDTSAWAAGYMAEHRALDVRWASYVYRRHPAFAGRYINVDSLGHRVTPQSALSSDSAVRVFLFGGSTLFGWFQRDPYTIPAEAARRLDQRPPAARPVAITNLAVAGHTFTQGLLELILQLRAGARPDVVVFYDGINDVMATVQNRRAGFPQNEWNRENDFIRGRREADESTPGIQNDLRAIRRGVGTAIRRSQLAQSIVAAKATADPRPFDTLALATDLARMYAGNARVIEALAAAHGFEAIYIWQPALLSSGKRLTPYEQWLLRERPPDVAALHVAAPLAIRDSMRSVAPGRFIDATTLFDRDTLDVYVDLFGHTYERVNGLVADTLMPALSTAIARVSRRPIPKNPSRSQVGRTNITND